MIWSRATEEHIAAKAAPKPRLVVPRDTYEAAVQRIIDQAHEDDETLPTWDGPNAGPGPYGAGR
jgi:hypothetical protein